MNDQAGLTELREFGLWAEAPECDRIFLRDHVRAVEIGAFSEEYGVTQNLRFNVVLNVPRFSLDTNDDVDSIVSYDVIVEAIASLVDGERIILLETLAERLAADVLAHKSVQRVWLRIEKMDRVSGSLGVEIERRRAA
jgi:dihydroneopterin aldolase